MNNTDIKDMKQFLYFLLISFLILQVFNTALVLVPLQKKSVFESSEISSLEKDKMNFATEEKIDFSSVPALLAVWNESEQEKRTDLPETSDFFADKNQIVSGCGEITLYDVGSEKCRNYNLEEYVTGTLLAEMPTSYDIEALKAQAVACRTYAVYKLLSGVYHNNGANLCTSAAHCQAFVSAEEVSAERYEIAKRAVDETAGIIMFYDGAPILSVFHASCGNMTNSSAEVWGGERAYLQSVQTWESTNPDMDTIKTYSFEKEEFLSAIRKAGYQINGIDSISVTRNPSGKTAELNVSGVCIKGEHVANAFKLRSCDYDVHYDENCGMVTFTVYGHGHGVGMSQKGAQDLAQKGYGFHEILKHYYRGISFGIAE